MIIRMTSKKNITDTFVSIYANRIDRDYEKRANERKSAHKLTENELKKLKWKCITDKRFKLTGQLRRREWNKMVERWKIVSVSMRAIPRPRDRKDGKEKRKERECRSKVILRTQGGERVKGCESNSKKEYETKKAQRDKSIWSKWKQCYGFWY